MKHIGKRGWLKSLTRKNQAEKSGVNAPPPKPKELLNKAVSYAMSAVMIASSLLSGLAPTVAYADPGTARITPVSEDEFEPVGYETSIDFETIEDVVGFDHVADVSVYYDSRQEAGESPTDEDPDDLYMQVKGEPGYALDGYDDSLKGKAQLRYCGGTYGNDKYDMIVTFMDWNVLTPIDGWDSCWFAQWHEEFMPGIFICEGYHAQSDGPDGYQNLNIYTVGLDELQVNVEFVYAGTNDPFPVMGHMTCIDLDVEQAFAFGGAVTGGRILASNDHLTVDPSGTRVDSANVALSLDYITSPDEYKQGLVEVFYDTTEEGGHFGDAAELYFYPSWAGAEGDPQAFFAMTSDFLTIPNPESPVDRTPLVKTADHTGPDQPISVGDHVEYTLDYQAHEQGVNCRLGYRYTGLDLVDVLPPEMRYVDGTGRLYDEDGNDITDEAGRVVYEGDNEDPKENTVRFEFDPDFLLTMPMEGEHYRFVFSAELTEYPYDGQRDIDNNLYVHNECYALINNSGKNPGNPVDTVLKEPVFYVDKSCDDYEWEVGDTIHFKVVYKQTVPNAQSRNTIVSDNLPEYLELKAETVKAYGVKDLPPVEVNANEWSIDFDKFNYGDELVVEYDAVVRQSGNGKEIINNAGIHANNAMDEDDPEEIYANTSNVEIDKSVDRYEGYVGSSDRDPGFFEYTVKVRNTQEGTVANNVVITDDSLPEGMKVGRNNDGSMMIMSLKENGAEVAMDKIQDRYEGTLADFQYRVGEDEGQSNRDGDFVHDQTKTVTPEWEINPEGTGWQMTIDHLNYGQEIEIVYRAYPEDTVSGWEIENEADVTADNSQPDDDTAVVWVNQPHFAIDKQASNDHFQVNDEILYSVKVTNTTPGTLARNVVISDLAHTAGVELLHDTIKVYDSRGEDITDSCTISYKNNPFDAETFIVETHRDLVAGMTDEMVDLYEQLMDCTDEASFNEVLAKIKQAIEDGKGANHESATEVIPGRPVWRDGGIVWLDGSNPLGIDKDNPREGSLSCETEFTVEYEVKINDDELAGDTVDNTALVVSDEPNTATTDDEVVDVKGPKLVIEKTSDKQVYQVGETGHYTLVATQTREDNVAENVVISDMMDEDDVASIVHGSVKATGPDGSPIAAEPEYVSAENGKIVGFTLATGASLSDEESITVTYDVVFEKAGTTLHNVAQANADRTVGGTDDNLVEVVDPYTTITLSKSVDRETVRFMEWATYTVEAEIADNPAKNVVISDMSLPDTMPIDMDSITVEKDGIDITHGALEWDGNGFSAHIGDCDPGCVVTITYKAQVRDESLMGTSVVNTATLTSDTLEEPLRDDAHVTVPLEEPDVTLVKDVDKHKIHVGDTVTYTIDAAVADTAEDGVENVVIGDASLPDAMHIDMASIRAWVNGVEVVPVNADIEGNTFSIAFGDLRAGETVTITYNATAQDESLMGTSVVNVATLTSDSLDEPLTDDETVEVVPEGETILNKYAAANKAEIGDVVAYQVDAVAGADLKDAVVTDKGLPTGMVIDPESIVVNVEGEESDAPVEIKGTGFEVKVGDLMAGDRVTITYNATVTDAIAVTKATNTAEITSPDLDEPVNDTEIVEVPGEPGQAPTLTKDASADTAEVGDTVHYTVRAEAKDDLSAAVITDKGLPAGFEIDMSTVKVEVNGDAADADVAAEGTGFKAELGSLRAGDVVEITYDAVVTDDVAVGRADNTATLTSPDLEDPINDTETVRIPGLPDVEQPVLDKKANVESAEVGDVIGYTVTVTAPSDLADAVVTDETLPTGLDIDLDTIAVTINRRVLEVEPKAEANGFTMELGDLEAGDVVEITYDAVVLNPALAGQTATNTAVLTSPDLPEPAEDTVDVPIVTVDESQPFRKDVSREKASPGDKVTYTLTVEAEDHNLTDAVVTDVPAEGIEVDEGSLSVAIDGEPVDGVSSMFETTTDGKLVIRLGNLDKGQTAVVTYEAVVDAGSEHVGESLENTATLTADNLDEPLTDTATVKVEADVPATPGTNEPSDSSNGTLEDVVKDLGKNLGKTGDFLAANMSAVIAVAAVACLFCLAMYNREELLLNAAGIDGPIGALAGSIIAKMDGASASTAATAPEGIEDTDDPDNDPDGGASLEHDDEEVTSPSVPDGATEFDASKTSSETVVEDHDQSEPKALETLTDDEVVDFVPESVDEAHDGVESSEDIVDSDEKVDSDEPAETKNGAPTSMVSEESEGDAASDGDAEPCDPSEDEGVNEEA